MLYVSDDQLMPLYFFCQACSGEDAEAQFERSGLPGEIVWVADAPTAEQALREYHGHGLAAVGDKVYWNDPDDDLCSQEAVIVGVSGEVVSLLGVNGAEIEALHREIEVLRPS